jgi:hypothetical protein
MGMENSGAEREIAITKPAPKLEKRWRGAGILFVAFCILPARVAQFYAGATGLEG